MHIRNAYKWSRQILRTNDQKVYRIKPTVSKLVLLTGDYHDNKVFKPMLR